MKLTVPTMLTLLRIVLIPVLVLVFYLPFKWTNFAAALIFAFAAITDWLDGWIARRYDMFSNFGAFLDPVADKLMVAVALVLLVQRDPRPWVAVPAAVIIGREIVISALREWMAELGKRTKVAVSYIGKVKTTAQILALVLMLYRDSIGVFPTYVTGYVLLCLAAVLTLWSMIVYLRSAWPLLRAGLWPGHSATGVPGPESSRSAP